MLPHRFLAEENSDENLTDHELVFVNDPEHSGLGCALLYLLSDFCEKFLDAVVHDGDHFLEAIVVETRPDDRSLVRPHFVFG